MATSTAEDQTTQVRHDQESWLERELASWAAPPGVYWSCILVVALCTLVWSLSYPGGNAIGLLSSILVMFALGLLWIIRLLLWLYSPDWRTSWRWLIAPIAVSLVILVVGPLSLRLRFEASRGSFDEIVAGIAPNEPGDTWQEYEVSDEVGWYTINAAYQNGEDVMFYTGHVSLSNAGFAYLPNGPDGLGKIRGLYDPHFHSLGDGWYWWVSSW